MTAFSVATDETDRDTILLAELCDLAVELVPGHFELYNTFVC